MTLCYDFDIFEVAPKKTSSDKELQDFLYGAGLSSSGESGAVALFRDPKTADALCRAPEALREYFLNSGFGLNTFESGAPAGRYPEHDEEARLTIIETLTRNAASYVLPAESQSEDDFKLSDFLDHLVKATPIDLYGSDDEAVDAISPPISKNDDHGEMVQKSVIASVTSRFLQSVPLLRQLRRASPENV